jgi:hypothetical protein
MSASLHSVGNPGVGGAASDPPGVVESLLVSVVAWVSGQSELIAPDGHEYACVFGCVLVSVELSVPVSVVVSVEPDPLVSGGLLVSVVGTPYDATKTSPPPLLGGGTAAVATHWTTWPPGTSATPHVHGEVCDVAGACFDEHATVVVSAPARTTRAIECVRRGASAMLLMRLHEAPTVPRSLRRSERATIAKSSR